MLLVHTQLGVFFCVGRSKVPLVLYSSYIIVDEGTLIYSLVIRKARDVREYSTQLCLMLCLYVDSFPRTTIVYIATIL